MTPEELKALHDKRVHGEHLASGVEQGVTWEVRERAAQAPWNSQNPDGWRESIVVRGEYRITVALPSSDAIRHELSAYRNCDVLVVAGHNCASLGAHNGFTIVGDFIEAASLGNAIESVKMWCRDCVAQGYVPTATA
jgi:hypothetical protein